MPTVKLILRTEKKRTDGTAPISVGYYIGNDKYRPSVGKAINPKYWDENNPDAPVRASYYDSENLNIFLRSQLVKMNKIVDSYYMSHDRHPSVDYVRMAWEPDEGSRKDFEHLWSLFQQRKTAKDKIDMSPGTVKNNAKVLKRLQEYCRYRGLELSFEVLDKAFVDGMGEWLVSVRNNAPNSTGSIFKALRTFLKWVRKYHNVQVSELLIADLPVIREQKWFTWLTEDEMRLIEAWTPSSELMGRCRDAFIIQFGVGIRVSDLRAISEGKKIYKEGENYYYRFKDQKTKGKQSVMIPDFVNEVLNCRLPMGLNWLPSPAQINENIKLICCDLKINEPVTVEVMEKGHKVEKEVPKWSQITTHTARRSLINILRSKGVHDTDICAITGQSRLTLQAYQHASKEGMVNAIGTLNKVMG